jgi:hypothetical protein
VCSLEYVHALGCAQFAPPAFFVRRFSTDVAAPVSTSIPVAADPDSDDLSSLTPPTRAMKYVAVTGGVVSGLGKGITSSSIGVLLKAAGLNVTSIKIDPYLVSAHNRTNEQADTCSNNGLRSADVGAYEPRMPLTSGSNVSANCAVRLCCAVL